MKLMLAGKAPDDLSQLRYPLWASPKLDGIRAYVGVDGVVYSRNNKPIPNVSVQRLFGKKKYAGLDGELIVGSPADSTVFRLTASVITAGVATHDAIRFYVFDLIQQGVPYSSRHLLLLRKCGVSLEAVPLQQYTVASHTDLLAREREFLEAGYEGVMLRDPDGLYKHGRSTTREGGLLKLKRFDHGTFVVIGLEEQYRNDNAKGADGKRTSHKAGKIGKNTLGALHVRDVDTGISFDIGTGWTDAERSLLWDARLSLFGRRGRYKFFPTGSKEKPRFPTFDCWL